MKVSASEVAEAAGRLGLRVEKPATLKSDEAFEILASASPDVLVVAAYGLLLPLRFLNLPALGCINIHASLLPRWRGAAPVHRAILSGDDSSGVSIMQMDAGLDTGPVLLERSIPIDERDTTGSLTEKLSHLGATVIVEALRSLPSLRAHPQDESRATHAPKIAKAEAAIDWSLPASHAERQVRAFNPSPGAEAVIRGLSIKVWEAEVTAMTGSPGSILAASDELVIACGLEALRLRTVQRPGARRMPAREFLRGTPQLSAARVK